MASNQRKTRLAKLEEKHLPSTTGIVQVVIYDRESGEPLTPLDPTASKRIWMANDGRGLQRNQR